MPSAFLGFNGYAVSLPSAFQGFNGYAVSMGCARFWVSMATPFEWLRRFNGITCLLSR